MAELMTIQGTALQIKEYKGKRVVTFKDIDTVHQRPDGTAKRNFNVNRKHFISGVDFYNISKKEVGTNFVQTFGFNEAAPSGMIITESGYLMLVKSFTDDLAWKVQRDLVDTYFKVREIPVIEEQSVKVSVMETDKLIRCAEIMAGCLNGNRQYVLNIIRHIVPDVDEIQKITIQTNDMVIDMPLEENKIIQVSRMDDRCYSKSFNYNQLNNYLIEHKIKHYWLQMEIGCSAGLIGKWCYGQTKPTERYRVRLCNALDLPVGYFDNSKRVRRLKEYE